MTRIADESADAPLDLLSTSQTSFKTCVYGAPLVAMIFRENATIQQTCCNHWDCPCCGIARAKHEYRRITWGAEVLADEGHKLYFWTLTCRGKELSYEAAMDGYYQWTNRLLTSARTKAQRSKNYWAYIQVTEHQKKTRAHPHSHLITTFCPTDAEEQKDGNGRVSLFSQWFKAANIRAGLGEQCKITEVRSAAAVSRYIAKYMFKDAMIEQWPPKWKRVRYSNNWPKPPYIKAELAITLLKPQDWHSAEMTNVTWICEDDRIFEIAYHRLANIRKRVSNVDF